MSFYKCGLKRTMQCSGMVRRFSVSPGLPVALCFGVCFSTQAATLTAASVAPTHASSSLALVPLPREIRQGAVLSLEHGISVTATGKSVEDQFTAADLASGLKERGVRVVAAPSASVRLILLREGTPEAAALLRHVDITYSAAMLDEGYVLLPEGNRVYDVAASSAGLYYGAQTLKQLVVADGQPDTQPQFHSALVRDWPAMKYRGQDDDLSRGPVPTLRFQEHQIKILSEYKVNLYSPYFENTLAYAGSPLAAPPGGAMTRADVEELVGYAKKYHVMLVPEQEAFGHLHHTLTFEMYSPLAETPHGSVLAPGQPGSLPLIQQWFTEVASMFPGPFIHIGADETFDLGKGQTRPSVEKSGLGAVYIDFLTHIYQTLQPLHKRLLFWGDVAMNDPELVKTLPKDMIAVAWEYNPHPEGFDKWLLPFVNAGMETWVAPGVNNWRLVYPDFNMGLDNIQRFVSDGQRLGSTGELNTVWNDVGEGLFNLDWYGILYGAAAGWQPGTSSIATFQNSYGQVFHGDQTGKINDAQKELMAAHMSLKNAGLGALSDGLFWLDPWNPEGQEISAKLLPVTHDMRLHAERAIVLIQQARAAGPLRETDALDAMEMGARRMDFIGYKFQAAQEIADEYKQAYQEQRDPKQQDDVARLLWTISGSNGQCQDLRDGYGLTRDLYRSAWLKENRPYWLDNMLAHYDLEMQLWIARGTSFQEIADQWGQTHVLPKPETVGLPVALQP